MTTTVTKPRKPVALKACYIGVARIFEQLEENRKKLAAIGKVCDEPSDVIHYRDYIESLVRLEAQADALSYVFQMERPELKKWISDMEAYYTPKPYAVFPG